MKFFKALVFLTLLGTLYAEKVSLEKLKKHEQLLRNRSDPRIKDLCFPDGKPKRIERLENFSIYNENQDNFPDLKIIPINTDKDDLDQCIISYSSVGISFHSKRFEDRILEIASSLKEVGFKGHFIYRVGGWPNMESGCLSHSQVPYGFKACAFTEVKQLGYKAALWIDSNLKPAKAIQPLFDKIKSTGFLFRPSFFNFKKYVPKQVIKELNISREELQKVPHNSTMIIGLDLENKKVIEFLSDWHELVNEDKGHYSYFPSQLPYSVLLYRHGCALKGLQVENLVQLGNRKHEDGWFFYATF